MRLSNRFAPLAQDDKPVVPPRKKNSSTSTLDSCTYYHVKLGEESVMTTPSRVDPHDYTVPTATFYGRCFNCHYRAHSHKNCPLRQAVKSNHFGVRSDDVAIKSGETEPLQSS